ncbi:MAG: ABC transporter permease [Firmicutes bacterium]|nr:ABC transporter permease [Bacillota bacterium]
MKETINNLYNYRQLLKSNVKKDIRGKYKGSFLGILWSFINPLLMTLVYAIVFPFLLKSTEPNYVTFIVIGILPWTYFTTTITLSHSCILYSGGIIKKVYFPREILPISVNVSGLINFLISCVIMFIFLIFSGIGFSWYILFLPLIILTQFILTQALALIISAVNVYVRDLEYIVGFFINMLFYATPILYSASLFSNSIIKYLIMVNPMATIIEGYRSILFYQTMPNMMALSIVLFASIMLLFISLKIFKKLERGFAEEI